VASTWIRCWATLLEKIGASALLARRRNADAGLDDDHPLEGRGGVSAGGSYGWGLGHATLHNAIPFSRLRRREGVSVSSQQWDERYSGDELVWTSTPNQFLVAGVDGLPAGRAVDLACGEGRNSIWLAERGWQVTGVDFSPVGLAKAKRLADLRGVEVTWVESAVENWTPPPDGFDLVAVLYLQLPQPSRSAALAVAASAVAPGGTLLVIAHDLDNLTRGYGGPPVPDVLYQVGDVTEAAVDAGLTVEQAEQAVRVVDTDDGPREAIDAVVSATRPL
jgi:SAM-dependent methyltransferase